MNGSLNVGGGPAVVWRSSVLNSGSGNAWLAVVDVVARGTETGSFCIQNAGKRPHGRLGRKLSLPVSPAAAP